MSLKILLADDSMTAQNMGKKILTDAGYEVVAVSNGAQAVKKIAEHKPDLAILDIYMPGYTGLEVCERVKGTLESSRTPVLLTVGKMEPYRVEDGARVHADGVIVKPFEASDLLAAVEKLSVKIAPPIRASQSELKAEDEIETSSFPAMSEAADDTLPERIAIPSEMQVSPAVDFETLGIEPMQHEIASAAELAIGASAVSEAGSDSPAPWQPAGFAIEEAAGEVDTSDEPFFAVAAHEPALELEPAVDSLAVAAASEDSFEVEFTSAVPVNVEVAQAPELEIDPAVAAAAAIVPETDPALLDSSEIATAFPTSFGTEAEEPVAEQTTEAEAAVPEAPEESADDFEARVAAAMAAYEATPVLAESESSETVMVEPSAAWRAEQVELDATEAAVSLESEMAEHLPEGSTDEPEFGPVPSVEAVEPEPADVVVENSAAEVVPSEKEPETVAADSVVAAFETEPERVFEEAAGSHEQAEQELASAEVIEEPQPAVVLAAEPEYTAPMVAAAAAAVGGMAAGFTAGETAQPKQDQDRIADAIQRVLDRLKPQIVSEITRELTKEEEKD